MIKKIFTLLLMISLVVAVSPACSIIKAQEVETQPDEYVPVRVEVMICPNCPSGVIPKEPVRTSRTFAHYEAFPCQHGTHTYDIYTVYETKQYARCSVCGYEVVISETTEHIYSYCSDSLPN